MVWRFNWIWFWLWREQLLRESLSLLYTRAGQLLRGQIQSAYPAYGPLNIVAAAALIDSKGGRSITQCYQQMHMLAANQRSDHKRLLRAFQLDWTSEHISVSLHQPEEVQNWRSAATRKR